ncbi:MAG: DUF885 domain-containing protein [candidate division NC10 bacterium]
MKRIGRAFRFLLVLCLLTALALTAAFSLGCTNDKGGPDATAQQAFRTLVEQYVDSYHRLHPVVASTDGNHAYDNQGLDDVSAAAFARETTSVKEFQQRMAGIDRNRLGTDLTIDYDVFGRNLESRLYTLEVLQPFARDPSFYADIIQTGVVDQMVFAYSGTTLDSRLQVVLRQLEGVPAMCDRAIVNLVSVPGELLDYGLTSLEDTQSFLADDVPVAFVGAKLPDGTAANTLLKEKLETAITAVDKLATHLRALRDRPGPKPSFALMETLVTRLWLEQGIRLPSEDPFGEILKTTLAEIDRGKQAFYAAARALDPNRDPLEVWKEVQTHHPAPGEVADVVGTQVATIKDFLARKNLAWLPEDETVTVKAGPSFMLYWYASMWQTGPFEPPPAPPGVYYVSDPVGILTADGGRSDAEVQNEFLTAMVTPELWSTSAHEAYPGHFLQGYWVKKVKRDRVDKGELSLVAVSWVFAPYSYYEGWAHYTEQMVREEGLQQDAEPRDYQEYLMGEASDELLRLCRTYAGIEMQMGRMSMAQATDFFQANAFITPDAAEAEAIRGVYDPNYILYSIGKMMILQLRADYRAAVEARGDTFSLREFHDRFLSLGQYPLPVVRAKLLDGLGGEY